MRPMAALRRRCYLGILLAGGFAGTWEQGWADRPLLFDFFVGIILVGMAAFLGGLSGFLLKNAARCAAKRPLYTGQTDDGMLVGGLAGAVLGLLLGAVLGDALHTAMGGGAGAFLGAMVGAMMDEYVSPVLELLVQDAAPSPTWAAAPVPAQGPAPATDDAPEMRRDGNPHAERRTDRGEEPLRSPNASAAPPSPASAGGRADAALDHPAAAMRPQASTSRPPRSARNRKNRQPPVAPASPLSPATPPTPSAVAPGLPARRVAPRSRPSIQGS